MLKLFLNTKNAVRLAYSSRVCFGVMRDQNSNNPHNKEQQEQPDDYESTAESHNDSKKLFFKKMRRYLFYAALGYFSYNYYQLLNDDNAYERPETSTVVLDTAKYVEQRRRLIVDFLTKPPVSKLLQDLPDPSAADVPKTLVLNLSDTLLFWKKLCGRGRNILKRPGLEEFLEEMSKYYEVVVLTDDEMPFVSAVCKKLDPNGEMIKARFGLEGHLLEGSIYVKELKYLNRDLRKVIVIENDISRMKYQPENALLVSRFYGDLSDNTLYELIPFLKHLAKPEVEDVRTELERFGREDPAKKFIQQSQANPQ